MEPHPSEAELRQWLDGALDEAESARMEAHIDGCGECRGVLARLPVGPQADTIGEPPPPPEPPDPSGPPPPPSPGTYRCPPGYSFVDKLGRGGMGAVVRAREMALHRDVAIKFVEPRFGHSDARFVTRFRLEAEAMARLRHPNIMPVYAVGTDLSDRDVADGASSLGRPYLVMEYAEGGSLADRLSGKDPVAPSQAAAVCEVLARATHHAHDRGVIHRDLKPSNILLSAPPEMAGASQPDALPPGAVLLGDDVWTPKLADFGLVKLDDAAGGDPAAQEAQTLTGEVWGSPGFMSPEQARGDASAVGVRSDVHALGAILYYLLIGKSPFDAPTTAQVIERVKSATPEPPRQLRPGIPADLELICLKALQKDPADRYASAADLADDLRRFADGRPIAARPFGPAERAWRWSKRNKALAATLVGLLLTMIAGTAVSLRYAFRADENARAANNSAIVARQERSTAEAARRFAEGETARANANAAESDRRQRQIEDQFVRFRWDDYAGRVDRIVSTLEDGRWRQAQVLLDAAPLKERSFEHRFLRGQLEDRFGVRRTPIGDFSLVGGLALSPDGSTIAVFGDRKPDLKEGEVPDFGIFPNAAMREGVISIRDAVTQREVRRLSAGGNQFLCATFSPDSRTLYAGDMNGRLVAWNVADGRVVREWLMLFHADGVLSVAASPDGRHLATVARYGSVRIWDVTTGQVVHDLPTAGNRGLAVCYSKDGTRVAAACSDGRFRVWTSADGKLEHQFDTAAALTAIAFSADGNRIVGGSEQGAVLVSDLRTRETNSRLLHEGRVNSVTEIRLPQGGDWIASAGEDGTVRLSERQLILPPIVFPAPALTKGVAAAGDGSTLYCAGLRDQIVLSGAELRRWDLPTFTRRHQPLPAGSAMAMRFMAGGDELLTVDRSGRVMRWQTDGRHLISEHAIPIDPSYEADISHDGQYVVAGSKDRVKVVEVASGRVIGDVPFDLRLSEVSFSAADTVLINGDNTQQSLLWRPFLEDPAPLTLPLTCGVLGSAGKRIYGIAADHHSIAVCDAATGNLIVEVPADRRLLPPAAARGLAGWPSPPVAVFADEQLLAVRIGDKLTVFRRTADGWAFGFDIETGVNVGSKVWFSPDGDRLLVTELTYTQGLKPMDTLRSWSTSGLAGKPVWTREFGNFVTALQFTSDSRRMAVAVKDIGVEVFDDGGILPCSQIRTDGIEAIDMAFAGGGRYVVAAGKPDGLNDLDLPAADRPAADPPSPTTEPSDRVRAVGVWDVATGEPAPWPPVDLFRQVLRFDVSPDGRRLAVAEATQPRKNVLLRRAGDPVFYHLVIWDLPTGREIARVNDLAGEPARVCFSPDGRFVACGQVFESAIDVRDADDLATVRTIEPQWPYQPDFCWTDGGKAIAVIENGTDARVWDVDSGQVRDVSLHHPDFMTSLAAADDGTLVTGCWDGQVRVWSPSGELRASFLHGEHHLTRVGISPDARQVLAGDQYGRMLLWNLDEPKAEAAIIEEGHNGLQGAVHQSRILWSPNGRKFGGASDRGLYVWTLPTEP